MEKLKLTLAMVLSGIASGSVVALVDGKTQEIALASDAPVAAVEVKGADKGTLLAEAADAEAGAAITCKIGVISNHPDRCYCTDGIRAGWLTEASNCRDVAIVDGKVYEKPALAAEAEK